MIELPSELLSWLQSEEARAFDDGLNEERKVAIDFYHGRPFGDEVEGRSQLVTRDVAEVIDYMTVSIMRTMVSDKIVEFEGRSEEEAQEAAKATELVAWQFLRKQSGYQITRDALMAGLLEKTGVIKTWAEQPSVVVEGIAPGSHIDHDETIIAGEPLLDESGEQIFGDDGTGEVVGMMRVKRRLSGAPEFHDAAVPNEEFGFSPEARSLDAAAYIVQRSPTTLQDLVQDGLSEDDARLLWDNSSNTQSLADARDQSRSYKDSDTSGGAYTLARRVIVNEEYVRWDWNGDGEAELIQIRRVGTKCLSVTPVDEQPYVIWCPFPMAHRIVGLSLADKTMDIQRIRSVLLRQAMDALYLANAPRPFVDMQAATEDTIDDLLATIPGAPIRGRAGAVTFMQQPFAAGQAFTALEFMTGERESRTGITRHNQGLNPDTLNKTASGMAMLQAAGAQIEEYVARNFGEALAELFEKKLRLMRKFGLVAQIKVGGAFTDVDAGALPEDMDMAVRVGLGTGRKDQRIAYRMQILEMQKQAMDIGSPLVDDEKLFNNADAIAADMGLGDGTQFFNDPKQAGEQEPKPDPALVEAEGKTQVEMQRQQDAHAKVMYDAETARLQMEAKALIDRERAQFEAQLARDKADFEADMARERMIFEQELARQQAIAKAAMADDALPQNRPGGRLDA